MLHKSKLHESFNFTTIAFRQLEVSYPLHSFAYHDPFVIKLVNDLQPRPLALVFVLSFHSRPN